MPTSSIVDNKKYFKSLCKWKYEAYYFLVYFIIFQCIKCLKSWLVYLPLWKRLNFIGPIQNLLHRLVTDHTNLMGHLSHDVNLIRHLPYDENLIRHLPYDVNLMRHLPCDMNLFRHLSVSFDIIQSWSLQQEQALHEINFIYKKLLGFRRYFFL